jgi:hypothetical protein
VAKLQQVVHVRIPVQSLERLWKTLGDLTEGLVGRMLSFTSRYEVLEALGGPVIGRRLQVSPQPCISKTAVSESSRADAVMKRFWSVNLCL